MSEVIGSWKVHCSRGPRIIRRGSQWRDMLTGSTWEVVEPTGSRIYSPSGLGGTLTFWCKPVGELTEAAKLWPSREDGCVDFCGDSIAAGLLDGDGVAPVEAPSSETRNSAVGNDRASDDEYVICEDGRCKYCGQIDGGTD